MEVMPLPGKPAATRQRTGAVAFVVRGVKIEGDEGGREHVNGAMLLVASVNKLRFRIIT